MANKTQLLKTQSSTTLDHPVPNQQHFIIDYELLLHMNQPRAFQGLISEPLTSFELTYKLVQLIHLNYQTHQDQFQLCVLIFLILT